MDEDAPMQVEEKSGPPKAMVKPQVLTHVIEGYVIQECECNNLLECYIVFSLSILLLCLQNQGT